MVIEPHNLRWKHYLLDGSSWLNYLRKSIAYFFSSLVGLSQGLGAFALLFALKADHHY